MDIQIELLVLKVFSHVYLTQYGTQRHNMKVKTMYSLHQIHVLSVFTQIGGFVNGLKSTNVAG